METPIIATTTPQAVAHAYIIEPSRPAYATYSRLQGAELARAFREKTGRRSATDAEEMKMSSSNSVGASQAHARVSRIHPFLTHDTFFPPSRLSAGEFVSKSRGKRFLRLFP